MFSLVFYFLAGILLLIANTIYGFVLAQNSPIKLIRQFDGLNIINGTHFLNEFGAVINSTDAWFSNHYYIIPLLAALITVVGVYVGQFLVQHSLRPIIFVDRRRSPMVRRFDVALYSLDDIRISPILRVYNGSYLANRTIIRNRGRRAAEECEGALRVRMRRVRIEEEELKLRWIPVLEAYKTTINAYSEEYLDVCAFLEKDPNEIFQDLEKQIAALKDQVYQINDVFLVDKFVHLTDFIHNLYPNSDSIPLIIAPTENGWHILHENRRLIPSNHAISYSVVVTSKNSNRIQESVIIDRTLEF